MGPLIPNGLISGDWDFVIAIVLGIAFGFILEASGFSSSRNITGVFYGYNFVVLRVFFTAVIVAMVGLMYFDYFGWLDISKIFILPTYLWPMILGGVIMGVGFIMGGFCPGTSFTAIAIGKLDGLGFYHRTLSWHFCFLRSFPAVPKLLLQWQSRECNIDRCYRNSGCLVCCSIYRDSFVGFLGNHVY